MTKEFIFISLAILNPINWTTEFFKKMGSNVLNSSINSSIFVKTSSYDILIM